MLCREIVQGPPVTCIGTDTVLKAAQLMKERAIGFLPIVNEKSRVIGVLTDRDIALRVVAEGKPLTTKVLEVMTQEVVSLLPDADLAAAEKTLAAARKSRLPLLDENRICHGILSLADIAQYESKKRAGEVLRAVTKRETKPEIPLDLM